MSAADTRRPSAIPDTGDTAQGVAGCEARLDSRPFPGLVCWCAKENGAPRGAPHGIVV